MLEALIPYITAPEKVLVDDLPLIGPLKLQLFGPLVATGVIIGWYRCLKYAKVKDLDEYIFRDYLFWMLVIAFTISHWVSVIFYFPHQIEENPFVLLQVWNGLSSVGGFFGAFVGSMLYLRWYCARQPMGAQPILIFGDGATFGLLIGWCFGRMGCSVVHDHPGKIVPEDTFLAVGPWPDGSWRYDLGLIELMFAITVMLFVYFVTKWEKWPPGRLMGLLLFVYAPFRFFLDSLRADEAARGVISTPDERYSGLTPAQWFTIAFFITGLWLLFGRRATDADVAYAKDSDRREHEKAEAEKAKAAASQDDDDDDSGESGADEAEADDDGDDDDVDDDDSGEQKADET